MYLYVNCPVLLLGYEGTWLTLHLYVPLQMMAEVFLFCSYYFFLKIIFGQTFNCIFFIQFGMMIKKVFGVKMKIKLLFQLFITFIKIGSLAFGGGYAVIPLLQREVIEHRKWISSEELTDMMAIAQTMPGVIMVNVSTMTGYRVGGFWGALTATTASILPTFVLTLLVTLLLWNQTENPLVKKAFTGVLLGVTALILYSIVKTWKSAVKNYFDIALVVLSAVLLTVFKVNVVLVILAMGAIGFANGLFLQWRGGRNL